MHEIVDTQALESSLYSEAIPIETPRDTPSFAEKQSRKEFDGSPLKEEYESDHIISSSL